MPDLWLFSLRITRRGGMLVRRRPEECEERQSLGKIPEYVVTGK